MCVSVCACVCVFFFACECVFECMWKSGAITLAAKLYCFVRFPILLALFQSVTWLSVVSINK